MKYLVLSLCLLVGLAHAQLVDVTKLTADPTTRLFSDGQSTVQGYVNAMVEANTECCGKTDVFLVFTLDAQGYVADIRALSGNVECIKKSVIDIWKYIRFSPVETPGKSIYAPVKVNIECKGDETNTYATIQPPAGWAGPQATLASGTTGTTTTTGTTGTTGTTTTVATTGTTGTATTGTTGTTGTTATTTTTTGTTGTTGTTTTVATTGTTGTATTTTGTTGTTATVATTGTTTTGTTTTATTGTTTTTGTTGTATVASSTKPATTAGTTKTGAITSSKPINGALPAGVTDQQGNFQVPPVTLAPPKYDNTVGDLKPQDSHLKTVANGPGPKITPPSYRGGNRAMAVYLRQALRKEGVCDLAHVLAELTITPQGKVSDYRIFNANNETVYKTLPKIIEGMEFSETGSKIDQFYYLEFKTDIECKDRESLDLRTVQPYISTPETMQNVVPVNTNNVTKPADK